MNSNTCEYDYGPYLRLGKIVMYENINWGTGIVDLDEVHPTTVVGFPSVTTEVMD